uniref:Uncharacterized protein n=1 Tax=Chenopodium quinoa TaxID=63459 RepID=A0A803N058_CHEQI
MTTYNLEETPDVFITPRFYNNKFEYRMEHINGEGDRKVIRSIDLRNEKLMVYGTEIKESLLSRLYDSLILRPKAGIIYVNCEGACYFLISGSACHRPIQNVIFDWSHFGVIIPNSLNDSLKKQLDEKDKNIDLLNHQVSSIEVEMQATKDNLKASMGEVEKLKEQVLTCKKEQNELGAKIQEAYERVALVDFELELYKIELDSYKKGEEEFLDEICSYKEKTQRLELDLQKTQAQLSSVNSELQSTKIELEISTKSIKELGIQLSLCKKENQELERKLKGVEEENSLISLELRSTKNELELSNKNVKDLEVILASCKKEDKELELQKIQNQLFLANKKLEFTKTMLESSKIEIKELKNQCYNHKIEQQFMDVELLKVHDHLNMIDNEVMLNNQKLDQLLASNLWMDVNGYHHPQATNLQCRSELAMNSSSIQGT